MFFLLKLHMVLACEDLSFFSTLQDHQVRLLQSFLITLQITAHQGFSLILKLSFECSTIWIHSNSCYPYLHITWMMTSVKTSIKMYYSYLSFNHQRYMYNCSCMPGMWQQHSKLPFHTIIDSSFVSDTILSQNTTNTP